MAVAARRLELFGPLARRLGFAPGPGSGRAWVDPFIAAWAAWILDIVNNLGTVHQKLAEHHARQVLDLERSLHVAPELSLNAALAAHHTLSEIVGFWYVNVHALVTFAVFVWLWWRRPDVLARLRWVLLFTGVVALVVFRAFPVAPPRMLVDVGYNDVVGSVHGGPVWEAGATSAYANQLSAFPSLHIAWAVWSSLAVWCVSSRSWIRVAAVVYPLFTTYAVMATSNHFLADAVAGTVLTAIVMLVVDRVLAWRRRCATIPAGFT